MIESLQYSVDDSLDNSLNIADTGETPSSLTKFYEHYVGFIAYANPVTAAIAETTLYWLVFGIEPIHASLVVYAISLGLTGADKKLVQPIDAARLVQCCQGLIVFSEETDMLQFVHLSAKEFFCRHLNSSIAHTYLEKICLLALTTLKYNPDRSAQSMTDTRKATMGGEALLDYAQRNHLRHCFQAVSTNQQIGPSIDADEVGFLNPTDRM